MKGIFVFPQLNSGDQRSAQAGDRRTLAYPSDSQRLQSMTGTKEKRLREYV